MKKILIIDDDKVFAKTLQDFLSKEKYKTIHKNNGEEGLKSVEEEKPDLIILDLLMSKMGGLDFLKEIEKKKLEKEIPILISSQLSKIEDISNAVVAGIKVGVKGYIIKSSENLDRIVKEIDKALNNITTDNS